MSRRHTLPVLAVLGALVLTLLGITAPWHRAAAPAQSGAPSGWPSPVTSSSPGPAGGPDLTGRADRGATRGAPPSSDVDGTPVCEPPLAVVAAPDIADLVRELAGPLTQGRCPDVSVQRESDDSARSGLAAERDGADVWIPASSLWLRLAADSHGADFGSAGTSLARTPVVLAFPQPVYDAIAGPGTWPVWVMVYQKVTDGEISRMSMPDPDTTTGALALVAFHEAISLYSGGDDGGTFLRTIHFRDQLAATDAEAAVLLDQLGTSSQGAAVSRIGVFPATEQQLLAYRDRRPSVPVVAVGMHDALTEADFPFAVSGSLDDRLATLAGDLRQRLRSPAAVQRLVEAGFRPPHGGTGAPAGTADLDRFPAYPAPVPLPEPAQWRDILQGWTWTG